MKHLCLPYPLRRQLFHYTARDALNYSAFLDLDTAALTACMMASLSMPNILSSSAGFPLRGTWDTARRVTVTPGSPITAAHTASPMPPVGRGQAQHWWVSQQEHPHSVCVSEQRGLQLTALGKHQSHMSEWANCEMKTLSCIKGVLRTSRLPFLKYSAISSRTHLPLKGTGLSASSHYLGISHQEPGLQIHFDWRAFTSVLNVLKFQPISAALQSSIFSQCLYVLLGTSLGYVMYSKPLLRAQLWLTISHRDKGCNGNCMEAGETLEAEVLGKKKTDLCQKHVLWDLVEEASWCYPSARVYPGSQACPQLQAQWDLTKQTATRGSCVDAAGEISVTGPAMHSGFWCTDTCPACTTEHCASTKPLFSTSQLRLCCLANLQ